MRSARLLRTLNFEGAPALHASAEPCAPAFRANAEPRTSAIWVHVELHACTSCIHGTAHTNNWACVPRAYTSGPHSARACTSGARKRVSLHFAGARFLMRLHFERVQNCVHQVGVTCTYYSACEFCSALFLFHARAYSSHLLFRASAYCGSEIRVKRSM